MEWTMIKIIIIKDIEIIKKMYFITDNRGIIPQEQKKVQGETAFFTCITVKLTSWTFNDGPLPSNSYIGFKGASLYDANLRKKMEVYIENVTRTNQGYYECEGVTVNNHKFYARAFLIVESKPSYQYMSLGN